MHKLQKPTYHQKMRDITEACTHCHGKITAPQIYRDGEEYYIKTDYRVKFDNQEFNQTLSDKMLPLNRQSKDGRNVKCKREFYPLQLPNTSVVMVFYNEHLSTLYRSIITLLEYTPPELLHEIILVDDFSENPYLIEPLQEFVDSFSKIKLNA